MRKTCSVTQAFPTSTDMQRLSGHCPNCQGVCAHESDCPDSWRDTISVRDGVVYLGAFTRQGTKDLMARWFAPCDAKIDARFDEAEALIAVEQ